MEFRQNDLNWLNEFIGFLNKFIDDNNSSINKVRGNLIAFKGTLDNERIKGPGATRMLPGRNYCIQNKAKLVQDLQKLRMFLTEYNAKLEEQR
tara:strand:- start:202 stop:480 length:279 start_codon:yes stop_codon:yes gene_type:complete